MSLLLLGVFKTSSFGNENDGSPPVFVMFVRKIKIYQSVQGTIFCSGIFLLKKYPHSFRDFKNLKKIQTWSYFTISFEIVQC